MFEEEAEEYVDNNFYDLIEEVQKVAKVTFEDGAEFGYSKATEEAMMKLKDEGIVKPLKDSILRNERLSSQEQQELCAWIECAMDFGEKLDECAKELEEANKANEWHNLKTEKPPLRKEVLWCIDNQLWLGQLCESWIDFGEWDIDSVLFNDYEIAWKEIVLPELKESE